jgi:hypothetical protein
MKSRDAFGHRRHAEMRCRASIRPALRHAAIEIAAAVSTRRSRCDFGTDSGTEMRVPPSLHGSNKALALSTAG